MSPIGTSDCRSGDNVGDTGIDDPLDLVLELKLTPFQPRNLQLVPRRFRREQLDSLVELAVLGLERFQQFDRIIVVHRRADSTVCERLQEPLRFHGEQRLATAKA
jgi:hypothetical protein